MKKLVTMGEALIDFVQNDDTLSYFPVTGGAPVNVAAAFAKLGGPARLISQVGEDLFGRQIKEDLMAFGVDTRYLWTSRQAATALAFVTLAEEGQRDFLFYRNPSADMLLGADQILEAMFDEAFCLHFCSVSLGDFPMREAHEKAIRLARDKGLIISFDPNLRLALWSDPGALKQVLEDFIPRSDILKIASDELDFITGKDRIEEALPSFFEAGVKLVLYTEGARGARAYTRQASARSEGLKVQVCDTTGAGDAFAAAFLYQLYERALKPGQLESLDGQTLATLLDWANRYSSLSVQRPGATASYPDMAAMRSIMEAEKGDPGA